MRKKLYVLLSLVAVICLSICVISFNGSSVKAEGELTWQTFVMENGAALRLKEDSNGMRFSAEISESEYTALKEAGAKFGVLIVAKDLLKSTAITAETVFGTNPAFYFTNEEESAVSGKIAALHLSSPACQNIDNDANIEICGSIVNILTNNFTRTFVGVAYVAIPSIDTESGYSYHFAPYYDGNILNNSRCMYYVAQKAIEANESVESLQTLYINPFSTTDRYTKYAYAVKVRHNYVVYDENHVAKIVHTEISNQYAKLNSQMTAMPIEKPTDTGKEGMEKDFILNVNYEDTKRTGLVYAGGMQVLDLYYEPKQDVVEDDKQSTLDVILEEFLKVENASHNFGLDLTANGGAMWSASEYKDENGNVVGINLNTTTPKNGKTLVLSKEFFEDLRAYGVETITFTLDATPKATRFAIYQEESDALINAYDPDTKEKLVSSDINQERITINIDDVTLQGGVRIELHNSASNNEGNYSFKNIVFGFEKIV